MNINPFSLFKKTSKGYIGLLLRETDGIIMYLQVNSQSQNLEKIDSEKFTLTNRWDHLADNVDDALYKLEVRTKKTFDDIIFFVYSHLVEPETHELKKQQLSSIKNLVKSMELKPLGFIEAYEAYLKYLSDKDKRELSALVVESDETTLTVFSYQSGRLDSQVSAVRKKSFLSDLTETLESLKETVVLPPHIILLPSKDHQEGADLVEHTWDNKLFSHQPTITLVTEDEVINSLIYAFAAQMKTVPTAQKEERSVSQNAEIENEESDIDEELALDQPEDPALETGATIPATVERMGFVIGGVDKSDSDIVDRSNILKPAFTNSVTLLTKSVLRNISTAALRFKNFKIFQSRTLLIHSSIIVGALLILIGGVLMELNFHRAVITMTLPSQKLELSRSFDAVSMGLKEASDTAKFESRVTATGVKNIGQPAKGTVTIYNSSLSQSKSFPKGTPLVGPGNLSFTLDSDVKIASASGDAADIVSSTAKSAVTASSIGPESNLASGTKFSVDDESGSSVIAKSDSSFTGGTKTQIQVVAEKDIAKATTQINEKANTYVKDMVEKSLSSDALLLSSLTNVDTQSKESDNKVGAEADSVNVKAVTVLNYSYVSKEKLRMAVAKALQPKVQKGFVIDNKNISLKILSVSQKNEVIQISLKATAHAVPPATEDEIIKSVKGKTIGALQKLAKEKYQAQSVEFVVEHPIGLFKNILPLFSDNIKLRLLYP